MSHKYTNLIMLLDATGKNRLAVVFVSNECLSFSSFQAKSPLGVGVLRLYSSFSSDFVASLDGVVTLLIGSVALSNLPVRYPNFIKNKSPPELTALFNVSFNEKLKSK